MMNFVAGFYILDNNGYLSLAQTDPLEVLLDPEIQVLDPIELSDKVNSFPIKNVVGRYGAWYGEDDQYLWEDLELWLEVERPI